MVLRLFFLAFVVMAVGVLIFLFFYNPADIMIFPRCPFLVLTGLKCPGCGTLRGIHSLLNFRFLDAWHYNPFMIISIPTIIALFCSSKLRHSIVFTWLVFISIILYWVLRNVL